VQQLVKPASGQHPVPGRHREVTLAGILRQVAQLSSATNLTSVGSAQAC
jgi:hypothetical protein